MRVWYRTDRRKDGGQLYMRGRKRTRTINKETRRENLEENGDK